MPLWGLATRRKNQTPEVLGRPCSRSIGPATATINWTLPAGSVTTRRWGQVCCLHLDSAAICSALLERAYAHTTTLSANLIECASRGQTDERLVETLDGLLCGDPDAPACARRLQSWGHSSGVAALVGMILGTDLALVSSAIAVD